MNKKQLLQLEFALATTCSAYAFTPSVTLTQPQRTGCVIPNRRPQHVPSSLQYRTPRRVGGRSKIQSSLFYAYGGSNQDGDRNDVFKASPATTLPIDFEQVQHMHNNVLGRITQHADEYLHTDDFFVDQVALEKARTAAVSETRQIVKDVSAIALPALGGMLLDPIMSLIDTACVGQISTTALAAMAPCTSIFQFVFFAFFFLSAATTNLVASNPPESVFSAHDTTEAAKRVDANERVVSNASLLAVVFGTMVTFSLFKFCDPLLSLAGTTPALLDAARPYLLIRAVGIPFVFLATVLQGASVGRGDAWRPLKIFGAAAIINLIGDVWLTLFKGWGATGAATATLAAQVGSALYYVLTSARLEKGVEASSKPLRDVALVWRGLPSKQVVKTFMTVAAALFSTNWVDACVYSMLTRTAALDGTLALAAHQVTLQVWWLLSFFPDALSVAAQTLITRDMKDNEHRVPKLIKVLYGMSATLGVAAAALTSGLLRNPLATSALVADVSVQTLMATLVPFATISQFFYPIAALSDGVSIGLGTFSQLPMISLGSFVTTAVGLSQVANQGLGIVGVWGCMFIFLSSRVAGHSMLSKKLRKYLNRAFQRQRSVQPAQDSTLPVAA
jgi:putative MATE family efflux protein